MCVCFGKKEIKEKQTDGKRRQMIKLSVLSPDSVDVYQCIRNVHVASTRKSFLEKKCLGKLYFFVAV